MALDAGLTQDEVQAVAVRIQEGVAAIEDQENVFLATLNALTNPHPAIKNRIANATMIGHVWWKKLPNLYKAKVGHYRIIYQWTPEASHVIAIGPRASIYGRGSRARN